MTNEDLDDGLPEGWEMRVSRTTGMMYFYNMVTKQSQWSRPPSPFDSEEIRCSHILIKHVDSEPSTIRWDDDITRTKEEALALTTHYWNMIVNNQATFIEIAINYSECCTGLYGGDMGSFSRGLTPAEFSDEAFKLQVGEVSKPVESQSGYHIILRTE